MPKLDAIFECIWTKIRKPFDKYTKHWYNKTETLEDFEGVKLILKNEQGGVAMNIALIAHDAKKELMVQFCIAYCGILSSNEIDMVLFFRDTLTTKTSEVNEDNLLRLCDVHNIPIATNIATAEVLIHGLERGDLDWRNIVNPK